MNSPRRLLSVPSSSQTSKRVKLVRSVHHSRRRTVVLREFIIMSAYSNTAIARACEVVSTLAPHQLCAPTYCSTNQVVLHFLKCLLFIFVFASWCVCVSWRNVLLIAIQHYYVFFPASPSSRSCVELSYWQWQLNRSVVLMSDGSHSARYVELRRFAKSPDIIPVIKWRWLRWSWHVVGVGRRNTYTRFCLDTPTKKTTNTT